MITKLLVFQELHQNLKDIEEHYYDQILQPSSRVISFHYQPDLGQHLLEVINTLS